MCRYAWHNYRDHFACFDCRKAFKYWQWEESDEEVFYRKQDLEHVPREIICPECSMPMADMGLDFRAPPKNDAEAWTMLKALYDNGFTFHSCGCSVDVVPPRTLRELPRWLEQNRKQSEGERLIAKFAEHGHK